MRFRQDCRPAGLVAQYAIFICAYSLEKGEGGRGMPGAGVGVADLSRFLIFSDRPFFSSSDCVVSHESSALAHSVQPRCAHHAHSVHTTLPCPLCSRVRCYGRRLLGLTLAAPILAIRS